MNRAEPRRATSLLAALAAASLCACAGPRAHFGRAAHYLGYIATGKAPQTECWDAGRYRACAFRSRSGPRDDRALVWFFHYADGDERSFEKIGLARAFFARLARDGAAAPTVVGVSFGSHWLLSATEGRREVVLVSDFENSVLADVEKRLGVPERRVAWGMSMGGYNAAELALRRPKLFARVALSCPALYLENPFTSKGRTVTEEDGRALFRYRLNDAAHWAADNPVALAQASERLPPFLLQPNRADEYGFLDGARALAAALSPRAVLAPADGIHCVVDAKQAADFLAAAP